MAACAWSDASQFGGMPARHARFDFRSEDQPIVRLAFGPRRHTHRGASRSLSRPKSIGPSLSVEACNPDGSTTYCLRLDADRTWTQS